MADVSQRPLARVPLLSLPVMAGLLLFARRLGRSLKGILRLLATGRPT